MGYQSRTIKQVVSEINESTFLPAIQREFVWGTDQIIQLFDSVLREYPISSFIFWNIKGEFASEQIKYKFVRNYIEDSVYPREFDDVNYRNRKVPEHEQIPDKISLVIDGQQRLSSFYLGLKGTYVEKQKYRERKNPDAWTRKQLHLNLLSDPNKQTGDRLKLQYDFKFKGVDPTHGPDEYWFCVGDMLSVNTLTEAISQEDKVVNELGSISDSDQNYIKTNLITLYNAIHDRDIVNFYEEGKQDNERILDVFIRANEGGTQLSKSEILLSIATSYWASDNQSAIDAKEEINNFVKKLNTEYVKRGYDFSTDFVLRTLLVVSDLPTRYKIHTFTHDNLTLMKDIWAGGNVQDAIESTIKLVSDFGIDDRSLSSENALIPIIFYLYYNDNVSLSNDSKHGKQTRESILQWLCSALLNRNFGQKPDRILRDSRKAIKRADDKKFPLQQIQDNIRSSGRAVGFSKEIIQDLFEAIDYNHDKIYLLLSIIYYPDPALDKSYQIDHIFPRNVLQKDNLIDKHDFDPKRAEKYNEIQDHVANLQLISDNGKKSDQLPIEWIKTRSSDYGERNHIPNNKQLLELSNFPEFVETRKKKLQTHIANKFN